MSPELDDIGTANFANPEIPSSGAQHLLLQPSFSLGMTLDSSLDSLEEI
jgi:hypothetical protein